MSINERIIRVAEAAKVPPALIKYQIYSTYGSNIPEPNYEIKKLEALEKIYNLV